MTQPLALPNYSALGSIVNEADTASSAEASLRIAGWKRLGGGVECSVFGSPCGTRVCKVVHCSDSGQEATLEAALANPDNPHLPTIYGFLATEGGALLIEAERLEPSDASDRSAFEKTYPIYRGGDWVVEDDIEHFETLPDGPGKEALLALAHIGVERGLCWDAHGANVMIRKSDGALVLNDALYAHDY